METLRELIELVTNNLKMHQQLAFDHAKIPLEDLKIFQDVLGLYKYVSEALCPGQQLQKNYINSISEHIKNIDGCLNFRNQTVETVLQQYRENIREQRLKDLWQHVS